VACTLVDLTEEPSDLMSTEAWRGFFLETGFGNVWLLRFGCLIALLLTALFWRPASPGRAQPAVIASLAAAALVSQAWLGHAAAQQGPAKLGAIVAYGVHTLAAAAWLGTLVPLAGALHQAPRDGGGDQRGIELTLERFSLMGIVAVALIILSGIANAYVQLGWPPQLLASAYGRVLSLKLLLFAALLVLAVANRFVYLPRLRRRLDRDAALVHLKRNVVLEQLGGAAVLGLAAALVSLAPPE
jgi:putative copper resistance protein D